MNMDKIFDQMETNPIRTLVVMWAVGGLLSLIGLAIAILIVVGVLNLVGVV